MSSPVRLGVLDFGIVPPGRSAADVLAETLEMAPWVESLGYTRYWLTEHHESHYAWTAPEVLMATVAQRTRTIRIGAAAILLCAHSPLRVAEVFRLLTLLHPGRIDLGLTAGLPADLLATRALVDDPQAEPAALAAGYDRRLGDLLDLLGDRFPPGHRFERGATPVGAGRPDLWLMGTGAGSALLAAKHGAALSYSLFHRGSGQDPALLREYRDRFRPEEPEAAPRANLALTVVCAEREDAAREQRALVEHWVGKDIRVNVSGTPEQCREQMEALAERFGVDELIVYSLWHLPAERRASWARLAEAFDRD